MSTEVTADLIARGGRPAVVANPLHLDDAAFGCLAAPRLAPLHLLGGEQPEVRMARAGVAEVGQAEDLGLQLLADRVQEIGKRWIIRSLRRARPEPADIPQSREVSLDLIRHDTPYRSLADAAIFQACR